MKAKEITFGDLFFIFLVSLVNGALWAGLMTIAGLTRCIVPVGLATTSITAQILWLNYRWHRWLQ